MPSTLAKERTLDDQYHTFLHDVIHGLRQAQKTLPCKYFYDARGSRLFEEICLLDEYYLTRTEYSILRSSGKSIAEALSTYTEIIEPGAGSCQKVQLLLKQLPALPRYIPLEISVDALEHAITTLKERFPALRVHPVAGDFTAQACLDEVSTLCQSGRRLVFFPGSTIGNFNRTEALGVLRSLKALAGPSGALLLGADLIKDRQRLLAAYDDKRGVTAEFNKNILRRINHDLNANFDVDDGFKHRAIFNEGLSRIEMQLVACREQTVNVAGEKMDFHRGEVIHTENSHKYSEQSIAELASAADMEIHRVWKDPQGDFGVFLLGQK
ncbi:MAG: L-histidine N(alpha)-methyltransferase [Spongiibacter marinus]|uniref:L-histidine N(alpha)-methyltransferase n=1 Tax=Spongiibacter marinus TaxID=354246 RepID=UPI003C5F0E4A